jgi:hypothetical protein
MNHSLGPIALSLAFLVLAPLAAAADTSGTFAVNGKSYPIAYAYAYDFPFQLPSGDGGVPESLSVVALSDRPFDAAALDRVCEPDIDIDMRAQTGAVSLNVMYGAKDGAARMLKYRVPSMGTFANTGPETDDAKLTLEKSSDGSVRGRLTIAGNAHMHEFDPDNIALVTADVKFDAKAPVSRDVKGEALPAGGGEPGQVYLAFNEKIGAKDAQAPLAMLRPALRDAMKSDDAPSPFQDIAMTSPKINRGVSDGQRARLWVSGQGVEGPISSQVCLIKEEGKWLIDGFLPAK